MALYETLNQCMHNRDVASYLSCLHDDFTVTFHKSGYSVKKDELWSMVTEMMANDKFIQESSRCVYENDDILVEHSFMSYPDNTREAVMLVAQKQDGKIIHMETGATSLD